MNDTIWNADQIAWLPGWSPLPLIRGKIQRNREKKSSFVLFCFFYRSKVYAENFSSHLHQCQDFLNFSCHFPGAVFSALALCPDLEL